MAEGNFSNEELFRLVVTLNGILHLMVVRLEELAALKVISPEYLKEMRRMTDTVEREIAGGKKN